MARDDPESSLSNCSVGDLAALMVNRLMIVSRQQMRNVVILREYCGVLLLEVQRRAPQPATDSQDAIVVDKRVKLVEASVL